nr:phycytochrome bilisome degradation protein [Boldiaceae sp.]
MQNELTLEQEFKLAVYTKKIKKLNNKQSQLYFIEILTQMMIKDNMIKYLIKNIGNLNMSE